MKRLTISLSVLAALLLAPAVYYFYAPAPKVLVEPLDKLSLSIGGHTRRYGVYFPPDLKPGARLLFALHPSMSSGDEMRRWIGPMIERFASHHNTVVVYPDGFEGHFNDCRKVASYSARKENIDDVALIKQITNRLVNNAQVDPKQVFALGYSIGGHLAFRLALETSGFIQGIIAIAANLPAENNMACHSVGALPRFVSLIEGTQDPINPYDGGKVTLFGFGDRGDVLSADGSAQWFADGLGISLQEQALLASDLLKLELVTDSTLSDPQINQHEKQHENQPVQFKSWRSSDAHVSLISIVGGGHTIPQANFRFRRLLGMTLADDALLISALASMIKTDL
mgnify:FL=1